MACPTCFQQITVPQAPASEVQKFILTGTKVSTKTTAFRPAEPAQLVPAKKFPVILAVVGALIFLGLAAAAIYLVMMIHARPVAEEPAPAPANLAPAPAPKPAPKPALIPPPASDSNWLLVLPARALPASPVAGRIHGKDFIVERASFQNGTLTLRYGTRGNMEFGALINFAGAPPEALAGKSIDVTTNAEKAARVSLRWKDDAGAVQKPNFDSGYALRLEFGALENNRLPGKIYLCLPDDEKSYLLGAFTADARKPKPKTPTPPKP